MTSLPISIPQGFHVIVQQGDSVEVGQILAKLEDDPPFDTQDTTSSEEERVIDLSEALGISAEDTRKFLKKGPGDSVSQGEIIAEKGSVLGLKKMQVISNVQGTVIRFERDTGKVVIRSVSSSMPQTISPRQTMIISPLAGTITVCNNNAIILESKSTSILGSRGSGGTAKGEIVALSPKDNQKAVTSDQITKDLIRKIVLVPDVEKEAVAKAAAIGVAGFLGTELSSDLFAYVTSRKIDLPIIAIDQSIGKKLIKIKNDVIMHGQQKVIVLDA